MQRAALQCWGLLGRAANRIPFTHTHSTQHLHTGRVKNHTRNIDLHVATHLTQGLTDIYIYKAGGACQWQSSPWIIMYLSDKTGIGASAKCGSQGNCLKVIDNSIKNVSELMQCFDNTLPI